MSVLIKGMEMPKCCKDCFGCKAELLPNDGSARGVVYLCQFTRTATGEEGVLDICPLIEVPTPYGRLIEEEPIIKYITDGLNSGKFGYDAIEVLAEIKYAPTIIPAEEGE